MTIRRIVIAALLASAGVAHADTITPPAPPSGFVSGWTTGNGTDVLGSGVFQGNLNLVGGVANTSGAGASLADVLYGKVAGAIGNVDGQTKLFFQRGIEANYLLASGHGILAATLGLGKSVVGSVDGAIISDGVSKAPGMAGGGNYTGATDGSGTSGGTSGGTSSGDPAAGGTDGGLSSNPAPSGSGSGGSQELTSADESEQIFLPGPTSAPNDNGMAAGARLETSAVEVPEPSSIALMLLGMMGAGAITRRRR